MNTDRSALTLPVELDPLQRKPRRIPFTLWLGLLVIIVCEAMLFADVLSRGRWAVTTDAHILKLADPQGTLGRLGRFVAPNMTPFAWFGFRFFMDRVLQMQGGSP